MTEIPPEDDTESLPLPLRPEKTANSRLRWMPNHFSDWMQLLLVLLTAGYLTTTIRMYRAMVTTTHLAQSSSKESNDATQQGLALTRKSIDQNLRGLELSERNLHVAENTLALSRHSQQFASRSFEASQRAWLTLKGIDPQPLTLQAGTQQNVEFVIENTGRSPARDTRTVLLLFFQASEPTEDDIKKMKRPKTKGSTSVAASGQKFKSTVTIPALSAEQIQLMESRTFSIFVVGLVRYRDEFRAERGLQFCSVYHPALHAWDLCANNNLVD